LAKIDAKYRYYLRCLLRDGFKRRNQFVDTENAEDFSYLITNRKLLELTKTVNISEFVIRQQKAWMGHIIREQNDAMTKILLFNTVKNRKVGRPVSTILDNVVKQSGVDMLQFLKDSFQRKCVD